MDLGDKCNESFAAVEGVRGVFDAPARQPSASARGLPTCACGGRPAYRPHPPLKAGEPGTETLACAACGNGVGPFASRQALAQAWRLYGCGRAAR